MADTPNGETVTPGDSQTKVQTPAVTPVTNAGDPTEVERLRKEKEQLEMERNQLRNKLTDKEKAEEDAQTAKLAEDNKFKELYEQEKAKREGLETEVTEKEKQAELKKAKQKILGDFNDEVKAIAEEAGMDLTDTDEATVAAFKEKLENISKRTQAGKINPNNPNAPTAGEKLSGDDLRLALQDDNKFHDIVTKMPGIKAMTKQG